MWITGGLEAITYLFFSHYILKNELRLNKIVFLLEIILLAISFAIYQLFSESLGNIFFVVLSFFVLINQKFLSNIRFFLLSVITINLIVFVPYSFLLKESLIVKNICEIIIYIILCFLIYIVKDLEIKYIKQLPIIVCFLNIFSLALTLLAMYLMLNYGITDIQRTSIIFFVLSSCLSVLTFFYSAQYIKTIQYKLYLEAEGLLKDKTITYQKEYLELVTQNYSQLRRFKHDMDSHFHILRFLNEEKRYEDLEKYLNESKKEFWGFPAYLNSKHDIINAILLQFSKEIEDKNINFKVDDRTLSSIKINMVDLVILFSNIIKNAIEAAECSNYKEVFLQIKNSEKSVVLIAKNSVNDSFNVNNILNNKTIKADQDNHGIGLYNIKQVVEKYNGSIEVQEGKDCVSIIVLLFYK